MTAHILVTASNELVTRKLFKKSGSGQGLIRPTHDICTAQLLTLSPPRVCEDIKTKLSGGIQTHDPLIMKRELVHTLACTIDHVPFVIYEYLSRRSDQIHK